jgi:hypothetical protein
LEEILELGGATSLCLSLFTYKPYGVSQFQKGKLCSEFKKKKKVFGGLFVGWFVRF